MFNKQNLFHGIEAMLDIAYHGRDGKLVRSAEITERAGIDRRALEPVLQKLVIEGLLTSIRGPNGGYRLTRDRRAISLGKIISALECPLLLSFKEQDAPGELGAIVERALASVDQATMGLLNTISLGDLCDQVSDAATDTSTTA